MSSQQCYFHPNIQAIDKCERCNKLICLQDKRTYSRSYGTSSISNNTYNSYDIPVKYTYCPPCYYQAMESGYRSYKKISAIQKPFMLIFMIPFILVPLGMISMMINSPFGAGLFILFPIIFIFIAVGFFIMILVGQSTASKNLNSEMGRIKQDKDQFYSSRSSTSNFNMNEIYCNQCGSKIQKSDLFCSNCGILLE